MRSLEKKSAIVTGSTSGIGLGVATELAREGASVLINGFGEPKAIETVRQDLEKTYGVTVAYSDADLSTASGVKALVDKAHQTFGRVDILVNNAGVQHVASVEEFPEEKWDLLLAVNLSAAFHAIKAVMPGMKQQGFGRIINVASAHGLVASKQKSAYVASKHGIIGLTKVVGLETARENITCNAICPGWVLTPLVQKQVDAWAARDNISVKEAEKALLGEKQPSLEFVTPEQIGRFVVFLCSDAARQITGTALSIDGGWTAQ